MTTGGSKSTQISRVPYLPGLDGLRAIAVLAVVVYHANPDWLRGGFLGVEVFFVISGYLITLLIVAESERTDSVSLRNFWARRARRLLPALFTMMVLVITWTAFREDDYLGKLRGDVVAGAAYVANWFQLWTGAGYTDKSSFAPLRHLWSLAVEEQFYLIWPLVMVVVLRRGLSATPRIAVWFAGIGTAIAALMAVLLPSGKTPVSCDAPAAAGYATNAFFEVGSRCIDKVEFLYSSTPMRATGLLLGAALALVWRPYAVMRGGMKNKGPLLDPLAVIGAAIIAFFMWKAHHDLNSVSGDPWLFRGGIYLVDIGTVLIIVAVAHLRAFTGRLLGNPVLRTIGERSYGLYLYHWPVFQAIRHSQENRLSVPMFFVGLGVSAVITELSYRFVELPIRERRVRRTFQHWWRTGAGEIFRRPAVGLAVGTAMSIPVFAVYSLATASVEKSDVEIAIAQGDGATTDVLGVNSTTTAAPDSPTSIVAPSTTQPVRYDVLAIGDSVMKGAAGRLKELGAVVDAVEDRQADIGIGIFVQLEELGVTIDSAVIHLGTNGPITNEEITILMDAVSEVPRVVILTSSAYRDWTDANNAKWLALPASYPNVTVLDWAVVSDSCVGDCFSSDKIHLNRDGIDFYAAQIWAALGREIPAE